MGIFQTSSNCVDGVGPAPFAAWDCATYHSVVSPALGFFLPCDSWEERGYFMVLYLELAQGPHATNPVTIDKQTHSESFQLS